MGVVGEVVVVSFSRLVKNCEGLTPALHRENILDAGVPEQIAMRAKEHGGISLEIAEGDDLFFGDKDDRNWEQELRGAIKTAQESLMEGRNLPQINFIVV